MAKILHYCTWDVLKQCDHFLLENNLVSTVDDVVKLSINRNLLFYELCREEVGDREGL